MASPVSDDPLQLDLEPLRKDLRKQLPVVKGLKSLYHYCSFKGMFGIVNSQELWLSNLRQMSDSTELAHAELLIRQELGEDPRFRLPHRLPMIDKFVEMINPFDALFDPFGFCFSMGSNDPGQWWRYGDRGRGYMLEFDARALGDGVFELFKAGNRQFLFDSVIYDIKTQRTISSDHIEKVARKYETHLKKRPADQARLTRLAAAFMASNLAGLLATCKNPIFSGETEFRLMNSLKRTDAATNAKIRKRLQNGRMVEYVALRPYPKGSRFLPIVSITCGPRAPPGDAATVMRFLQRRGIPGVRVRQSQIAL